MENKRPSSSSRRDFLKKGAAVASGVVAGFVPRSGAGARPSAPPPGGVLGANDRVTVGLIGLGWQGHDGHLATIVEHGTELNLAVAAVCDPWTVRLDRARTTLSQSEKGISLAEKDAYADYRRILDRDDIDAVFIATPDHWHARIAIDAMQAGKHVYCEKPLTRYLGEAFELHDAVERTGRVFQMGSQYCSEGKWHKAAELISAGKIGKLVLAQDSYMRNVPDGDWNAPIDPLLTPETLDWDLWVGHVPNRPFSPDDYFRWKKYHPYSAGIISNLMTHRIVPLMLATGTPEFPTQVACMGSNEITPDRDVPDNTQLMAQFPGGFAIVSIGSTVNEIGLPPLIRGHEGTIYFGGNSVELRPERPFADLADVELHENVLPEVSVRNHVANWLDVIRNGGTPTGNIDLSLKTQTVVCLAEMSQRLGEMMHFDAATRTVKTGSGRAIEPITYGTLDEVGLEEAQSSR